MALIASEPQGKKSAVKFQIDADTKQMLKLYTQFSGNQKPDPVINGALKLLFKTDIDFAPWLEQHKHREINLSSPAPAGSKSPTAHTATKPEHK